MKAILEFNIDDLSDDMALKRCHKAIDMAMVIWDFTYNTKKSIFYEIEAKKMSNHKVVELCFNRFFELIEKHNIVIDELIE